MKKINVLSLCDGMSCGQIALKNVGVEIDKYFSCEIDKLAIKVTQDNFPETIQLGDVISLLDSEEFQCLPKIDLVMFGFPCKSLSIANAGRGEYNAGLKGSSGLFYECVNILDKIKEKNPEVKFLVENVIPTKESDLSSINQLLGVEPLLINSNVFSAQDRRRFYWTNLDISLTDIPTEPSLTTLEDILDKEVDEKYYYKQDFKFHGLDKKVCATLNLNGHDILKRVNNKRGKSPTLTALGGGNTHKKVYDETRQLCRKLTPNEYRKLQTIPENYKMNVSDSAIYKLCGNGWTVKVIELLFSKGLSLKN